MRNLLISIFLLTALLWATLRGYHLLTHQAQVLSPTQQATLLIIGLISIFVALILASAIRSNGSSRKFTEITHRRLDLYENFIIIWQTLQTLEATDKINSLQLQANELKSSMALVASTEVLRNLNRLLDQAAKEGPHASQKAFEDLLLSMRRDLQLSTLYPMPKELSKLFANSQNEH